MKSNKLYYILLGALRGVYLSVVVATVKPKWTGNYYGGWREGINFCDAPQLYQAPAKASAKKPIAPALKP